MEPGKYFPSVTPVDELMRSLVYLLERAIESEDTQKRGFTFLANMANWGWHNFSVHYASTFFDTLQNRFPARVGLFLIVDPPSWFGLIWRLIRPMMSSKFASKVNLPYSSDLGQWFDEDNIPKEVGGKYDFDFKKWVQNRYTIEGIDPTDKTEDSEKFESVVAEAINNDPGKHPVE